MHILGVCTGIHMHWSGQLNPLDLGVGTLDNGGGSRSIYPLEVVYFMVYGVTLYLDLRRESLKYNCPCSVLNSP